MPFGISEAIALEAGGSAIVCLFFSDHDLTLCEQIIYHNVMIVKLTDVRTMAQSFVVGTWGQSLMKMNPDYCICKEREENGLNSDPG
jgi:hypothetical protein